MSNLDNLIIKELNKFIINNSKEDNKESILNNLNKHIYNISIKKELIKNKNINTEFINKLEELTIEQIILLKLELISNKYNIIIPIWFINKLDYIIQFIVIKYSLSKFNNIKEVLIYLGINNEIIFNKILDNLNYITKKVDNDI
jgi:hypothetical protein